MKFCERTSTSMRYFPWIFVDLCSIDRFIMMKFNPFIKNQGPCSSRLFASGFLCYLLKFPVFRQRIKSTEERFKYVSYKLVVFLHSNSVFTITITCFVLRASSNSIIILSIIFCLLMWTLFSICDLMSYTNLHTVQSSSNNAYDVLSSLKMSQFYAILKCQFCFRFKAEV